MSITTQPADLCADRSEWMATRPTYIGSSESPAILGCGYSGENAHTVWLRKMGMAEEMEDSDRLLCGRLLQHGITAVIRHKTNYDIRPADEYGIFRSKDHPWLGATPDSLIYGDPRGLGVCEIKNVDHHLLNDWKGESPPLRVNVQLQHQLLAVGATWGICAAIVGGNRPVWFEVEIHQRFLAAMLPKLEAFWRLVESKTPPPIDDTEGCGEALKALYPSDNGQSINLPDESVAWFDELNAIKNAQGWLKKRRTFLENQVKAYLGEAAIGILPDGRRFTWKEQTAHYEPQPARTLTTRVLRQQQPSKAFLRRAVKAERITEATSRLLAMGATLYHESESGSRYFELAGGLRVRLADHAPNQKTAEWMDRGEVVGIRVDQDDFAEQLAGITGTVSESEG